MKLLKKSILLSLVAPLLFSLLSFTNVVADKDVLIVRVCENTIHPRITISSRDKTTLLELEKEKSEEAKNKNLETATKTLEQYLKEGYKIESSNSVVIPNGQMITTYILTK